MLHNEKPVHDRRKRASVGDEVSNILPNEKLVRLSDVDKIVERFTGERPHLSTIHRWHQRGCKGVKLKTAFAGGVRRTTETWVREFFEGVTAVANGTAPPLPASKRAIREREIEQAKKELSEAGV